MAIRTTSIAVAGIIEVDVSIPLDPFIETGSALVDSFAAQSKLDAARLELIERWLSAHFYAMRDPRTSDERAGPVAARYQSAVALRLNTSHYGQMAMVLDTSGLLSLLSKSRRPASVTWLGTPPENQTCP